MINCLAKFRTGKSSKNRNETNLVNFIRIAFATAGKTKRSFDEKTKQPNKPRPLVKHLEFTSDTNKNNKLIIVVWISSELIILML